MSADKTEVVVICEGSADATFCRRFLKLRGYDHRKVRVLPFPAGKGCGEQFVRNNFPNELKENRRWKAKGLIVLIDGDGKTIAERKKEMDDACQSANVAQRTKDEPVVLGVPQRNIESWFVYLEGGHWSETEDYAKRKKDSLAKNSAKKLHEYCFRDQALPQPAPASLGDVCDEWKRF